MSTIRSLAETILDDGTRSINWFNGRLVTAEAMTQDRKAIREGLRSLGRVTGEGIAFGLEVAETPGSSTPASPVVTVTAGLAINGHGEVLRLCADADVSLLDVQPAEVQPSTNGFQNCRPPQTGVYVAGEGVYLLVMSPATAKQGRAVVSGLGNTRSGCDASYVIDGVVFRLLQITLPQTDLDDVAHLRNVLAYRCLGGEQAAAAVTDPFGSAPAPQGPLDTLRALKQLIACDVPLALVYWTAAGVQFIDMWSVRRRVTQAEVGGDQVELLTNRMRSQAEARFLQFQDHVNALQSSLPDPLSLKAGECFRHLPPAGILPLADAGQRAFDPLAFFDGLTVWGPVFIEGARVEHVLRESFAHRPIDTSSPELLWCYFVRENHFPISIVPPGPAQHYLVFTSGYMAFYGEARFDLSRWDFSNYSSPCP